MRDVNVYTNNFRKTGINVSVPQYAVDLTVQWTSVAGVAKERTETVRFPNILSELTAADAKDVFQDICLTILRRRLEAEG